MQAVYLKDPYQKELETTIKSVKDKFVVLDETIFYPQSGGQPHDTGTIIAEDGTEYKVVYAGKFNNEISHEVDKPGLTTGEKVRCRIDWERRYKFMRYHTAAHLLSAIMKAETGAEITGNNISVEKARIDFSLPSFDRDLLAGLQEKANRKIMEEGIVETTILPREEAMKIHDVFRLRKAFDKTIQEIRIVKISGTDIQACGGTHVKDLKEIKGITIINLENKGKERKRIYFVLR